MPRAKLRRYPQRVVTNTSVGGSDAQSIIVTSAMVTFALGYLNSYMVPRKTPRTRLFIGVAILYIGLSVVAQFNPKLARSFAILIMVTALLGEGGGVLNYLLGRGTHDHIGMTTTGTPNLPPVRTVGPAAITPGLAAITPLQTSMPALNVRNP